MRVVAGVKVLASPDEIRVDRLQPVATSLALIEAASPLRHDALSSPKIAETNETSSEISL